MGYQSEDGKHEGYAVAYVLRDECFPWSGLYRELLYPVDKEPRKIEMIGAGCDCGWRSPRWIPSEPTHWHPYCVNESERDDEKIHRLWKEHVTENAPVTHESEQG